MHPNTIYVGLNVVPVYVGTLGPKYTLFGYMDPYALTLKGTLFGYMDPQGMVAQLHIIGLCLAKRSHGA